MHVTGNQPAALDLDLAVVDRSRDAPARFDQKPLLHDEIALEAAADLGFLDRGGALEQAGFGDTEIAAIRQVGLDAALDDSLSQDVIDRMISRPAISFRTSATLRLGRKPGLPVRRDGRRPRTQRLTPTTTFFR